MKYLLDTSVWLWSVGSVDRLNKQGRDLLADGKQELYLSAASTWEISIKAALGKLRLPESPGHTDPFDRLLIAQAQLEDMAILTADRIFRKYKAGLAWCG